jgi:hypothetical protein
MDALIETAIAWKVAQEKQNIDTKDEVFKTLGISGLGLVSHPWFFFSTSTEAIIDQSSCEIRRGRRLQCWLKFRAVWHRVLDLSWLIINHSLIEVSL